MDLATLEVKCANISRKGMIQETSVLLWSIPFLAHSRKIYARLHTQSIGKLKFRASFRREVVFLH